MNRALYEAIKTKLETALGVKQSVATGVAYIDMWNDQLSRITDEKENQEYIFDFPAILIEFRAPQEIQSIGNNVQIFDPLDIIMHIVHHQFDGGVDVATEGAATDSVLENNLSVMDFKQRVYKALSLFCPTGCSPWVRNASEQDYSHGNLYHYVQTFRTTFLDRSAELPMDGIEKNPPTDWENNIDIVDEL